MTENIGAVVEVPSLIAEGTDANFVDFVELSKQVPVIVDLWATWCEPCKQLSPLLEKAIAEADGAVILVTVEVDANPEVASAFQVQSIPTVVALIGGQLAPLFQGALPEAQVKETIVRVVEAAVANGVTGRARVGESGLEGEELPTKEDLPPLHQEAFDAIERADYAGARDAYDRALVENPNDQLAREGRAQVNLILRLQGKSLADIRQAAAHPADLSAMLDVADLDLSGGHVDDAFDRLLEVFVTADANARNTLRERLLEMFLVVGETDPRVLSARTRLASLLF